MVSSSAYPQTRDEIYQSVLFHGTAMQGIERVEGLARAHGRGMGLDRAIAIGVGRASVAEYVADRPTGH